MPAKTERQRRAACAALGDKKRKKKRGKKKPFSGASKRTLKKFCQKR